MRDFSLKIYQRYLEAIKNQNIPFFTFEEYFLLQERPHEFCLIRHDVDRFPKRALSMAIIEKSIGVKSTYYFRSKPWSFDKNIISEVVQLGHEVGYHYENLSDTNGDIEKGMVDFEKKLKEFRKTTNVKTISMHGRPLKKYDNRELWSKENHSLLKNKLGIFGEVYKDIDYSDIAYINDTGRNWTELKSNNRDKVKSDIKVNFKTSDELLNFLKNSSCKKICFQIHPERWVDDPIMWSIQWLIDISINLAKKIMR